MKRIEFRGKDKMSKLWVYGSLIIYKDRAFIIFKGAEIWKKSLIDGLIEVIPKSVGQLIGRHDKSKKEIYAGDIVKWENNFGERIIGWIRYAESKAGFYVVLIKGGYQPFYNHEGGGGEKLRFGWGDLNIVGNQTENPEMMKYEYWRENKETKEDIEKKNEFLKKFEKEKK